MNHEIMTIEEVAEYLRVSERTVYDWAQKGQLPGGKLGTTWRFKRSEIEGWVNRQLGTPASASSGSSAGTLSRILSPDRVVFLDTILKAEALQRLARTLSTSSLVHNLHELETSIFRREELMSTGIGFGVGVPHVRIGSVDDLVMALGIARKPIGDYSSLDQVPVQIICMVAAGSSQHSQYIRALSAISSRLKDEQVRKSLIEAPDTAAAYTIFTGEEA
jgi:PTS system nitrogen regulatory IIA component